MVLSSNATTKEERLADYRAQLRRNKARFMRNKEESQRTSSGSSSSSLNYTPMEDQRQSIAPELAQEKIKPYIPPESKVITAKDSSGRVVGIQDPVSMSSYAIRPTEENKIRALEQERARSLGYTPAPSIAPAKQEAPKTKVEKIEDYRPPTSIGVYNPIAINNIDPATQKILDKQAAKEKRLNTPVLRQAEIIKDTFIDTFTFSPLDTNTQKRSDQYTSRGGFDDLALLAGGWSGLYASSAITAGAIVSGSAAGRKVTSTVSQAFTSGNQILNTGLNIVGNVGVGLAGFETAKIITKTKEKIADPKQSLKLNKAEEEAFNIAREKERNQLGFIEGVGFSFGLGGNKNIFQQSAEEELRKKGFKGEELTSAIRKLEIERKGTQSGALVGTLASGAFSEFTGRTALNAAFTSGAKPTFWTFATNIAPAGFGEGFTQIVIDKKTTGDQRNFFTGKTERNLLGYSPIQPTQEQLSDPKFMERYELVREKTKFSTTPFTEALGGGVIGAGVSGLLGGFIGTTAVKGQKTRSFLGRTVGNILDPTEYPSDILAEFATSSGRSAPVVTFVPTFSSTPTNSVTATNIQTVIGTPSNTVIPTGDGSYNFITGVPSQIPANVPNQIPEDVPNQIPADVPSQTPTNINNYIFTDVPADVPNQIPVNINIPSQIPVNIPVPINRTFGAGLPVPLPISIGGSGGYVGGGRKSRVGFIDELTASKNIFKGLVGFNAVPAIKKQSPAKRKTATKKRATRAPEKKQTRASPSINSFNKLAFGF